MLVQSRDIDQYPPGWDFHHLVQAKDTQADAKSIDNLFWNGCLYPECQ
jgi:hypothetical protein